MRTHEECLAFIKKMQDEYSEKRSDVSDNCQNFLEGNDDLFYSESRYTYAEIPGTTIAVEYDSLTTLIMFSEVRAWRECANHEYKNDEE